MRYFNTEHIDRVELEKSLDFENLTMTEQIETDIKSSWSMLDIAKGSTEFHS